MKTNKETQKFFFCGVQGCCPFVEIVENNVFVDNDRGNRTQLSIEEWNCLVNKVRDGTLNDF